MAPVDDATNAVLPGWVKSLRVLAPVASGLATIATNPKEWLRGFVFELIGEWLVGGVLDALQYVLGWLIFAFELVADGILTALGPLASPFEIVASAVTGMIETLYGAAYAVAGMAGLAGPPAAVFAVALLSVILAAATYGLLRVIPGSDAVEGAIGVIRE